MVFQRFRPQPGSLQADLIAGLTTAVMLIPQAMAYAILAGLPPIVGLYAAAVPLLAYALVGSSPFLAVGPVAMDSLLTAATVGVFASSGSTHYLELAALLALIVGAMQFLFGLAKGGVLVNFLSGPVISGFTSAAAIIIGTSQLKTLLGLQTPRSASVFSAIRAILERVAEIHLPTLGLSLASVLTLWALKKLRPSWPRALILVAASALTVHLLNLEGLGVSIIGAIPAGLPSFSLPNLKLQTIQDLLPGAMTIAMVAFMESMSISTKLSSQNGHRLNANRELCALGLANLSAGVFGAFPVAGGLSRTAVNADAGARSKLAGVVTAITVIVALLWLTPLLYTVPRAALSAIIVVAVGGLFDWRAFFSLWQLDRGDAWVLLVTFGATLTLGIQQGILTGVGLSLLLVVLAAAKPKILVLGQLPASQRFAELERYPDARVTPGVLVLRADARLFFANAEYLQQKTQELETQQTEPVRTIILSASGINGIDSSAMRTLERMVKDYRTRDLRFVLTDLKAPLDAALDRAGLLDLLGDDGIFDTPYQALRELGHLHRSPVDDPAPFADLLAKPQ